MITNRYYITTIIAIFLSLSLGILIGGTLGQQWINDNQQKLINHYENKAENLAKEKDTLLKEKQELNQFNEKLKDDYKVLFTSSIANSIEGQKILWINDTNQSFEPLRNTVELAGGIITEIGNDTTTFEQNSINENNNDLINNDVILFFPNDEDKLADYKWLLDFGLPVIYITDNKTEIKSDEEVAIDIYEQKVDIESLNEHYKFVLFLKNLLQENQK